MAIDHEKVLSQIGDKLNTVGLQSFNILKSGVFVEAVGNAIALTIFIAAAGTILYKIYNQDYKYKEDKEPPVMEIIVGVASTLIIIAVALPGVLRDLLTPEYGAIMKMISAIKK